MKPLCPELEDLARQLESVNAQASAMVESSTPEALVTRPAGGGWSAADNLAHLAVTVRLYNPKVEAAIAAARQAGVTGTGPFNYGLLGKFFMWVLEPPVRMKVKAPPPFHPAEGVTARQALDDLLLQHRKMLELIEAADGLDLGKVKVQSPASDKLKLSLGAAFGSMAAHGRRHLWQAKNTLAG
jgi:hypothetical protein